MDITSCLKDFQSSWGMLSSWLATSGLSGGVVMAMGNPLALLGMGLFLGGSRISVAAATGETEALQLIASAKPGFLICANDLDQGDAASLVSAARRQVPDLRVLFMLSLPPFNLAGMDWQSVDVLVCRDDLVAPKAPLQQAALAIATGRRYFSPGARALLALQGAPGSVEPPIVLTSREEDVLRCLLQGFSDREIARELCVTPATVRDHGQNIRRKFGVASRNELLGMALRRALGRRSWLRL